MKKIYNSKAFWMIVSLLASLAIWVYVTSVETDESKTTFRGVKVELVGEDILRDSKNLVVTDMDTSTVTVEVVGPRRIIGSLSSDQLVAQGTVGILVDVERRAAAGLPQFLDLGFQVGDGLLEIEIVRIHPVQFSPAGRPYRAVGRGLSAARACRDAR